ncbi:MAG: diacylglycerol kinase [Synergistaceae bacterium]|nr:diacylglycerol kinase [Synergistaceae bacterium]
MTTKDWKNSSLFRKTLNSLNGFRVAFIKEKAIMQETVALVLTVTASVVLECDGAQVVLVFLACLLPITLELVNSAMEIFIDHVVGSAYREEIRRAKDMLSAAVCLALIIGYSGSIWIIFFSAKRIPLPPL